MARNFLSLPLGAYKGGVVSKTFNTGNGRVKGTMVALDLLWPLYQVNNIALGAANPNFVVNFNGTGLGTSAVPNGWFIQSVYIDNEDVDFPVYIYFTDTQFTVSCPANSAGWYQVFTNGRQALIAGIGISDSAISAAQRTRVFFTDAVMTPALDQELPSALALWVGSNVISRPGTPPQPGYGIPALGDQYLNANIALLPGTAQVNLPPLGPFPGLFIYLTQIQVFQWNLLNAATGIAIARAKLGNTVEGDIFNAYFNGGPSVSTIAPPIIVADIHGNFRYDASTRAWFLNIDSSNSVGGSGTAVFQITYTLSQN